MTDNEYNIMAMIMGLADKLGVSPEELAEAQYKMKDSTKGCNFAHRASKKLRELENKK